MCDLSHPRAEWRARHTQNNSTPFLISNYLLADLILVRQNRKRQCPLELSGISATSFEKITNSTPLEVTRGYVRLGISARISFSTRQLAEACEYVVRQFTFVLVKANNLAFCFGYIGFAIFWRFVLAILTLQYFSVFIWRN